MVVVEIRTPVYDEESSQVQWRLRALVKAEDGQVEISGEALILGDESLAVVDIQTGRRLSRTHDPEAWTRNLPHAYRAGDLVAHVVIDTDPPKVPDEPGQPRDLPFIPAPPALNPTHATQSA
ncbi:MAG: hypothetical protein WBQ21_00420 [Solirubrobacteraceae bacterium]